MFFFRDDTRDGTSAETDLTKERFDDLPKRGPRATVRCLRSGSRSGNTPASNQRCSPEMIARRRSRACQFTAHDVKTEPSDRSLRGSVRLLIRPNRRPRLPPDERGGLVADKATPRRRKL